MHTCKHLSSKTHKNPRCIKFILLSKMHKCESFGEVRLWVVDYYMQMFVLYIFEWYNWIFILESYWFADFVKDSRFKKQAGLIWGENYEQLWMLSNLKLLLRTCDFQKKFFFKLGEYSLLLYMYFDQICFLLSFPFLH